MKKILLTFAYFVFLGFFALFAENRKKYEIKTIVIDAGHGGHDTGCLGSSGKEKDIALDISLKLGKLIQENYPDVKVIYTRKTDVFVELHERAEIANQNKADLFICIHANSGGEAIGTETFVLGLHRAEENLAVSKRENSAILMEKDYKTQYDGFDPNSAEANIIFRLYQSTYLQQSLLFAAKVQDQLNDFGGRVNRGVKQAGLLVLARTTMPGVLIESGFLTNKSEEKYLLSSKGQTQIATSIFRAFKEYKIDMEESTNNRKADNKQPEPVEKVENKTIKDTTAKPVQDNSKPEKRITPVAIKNDEKDSINEIDTIKPTETKPATSANSNARENPEKVTPPKEKLVSKPDKKPGELTEVTHPEKIKKENNIVKTKTDVAKTESGTSKEVFFTVQLAATENPTAHDRDRFKSIENIIERKSEEGITRFTKGIYFSLNKAIAGQNEMRAKGFKDAFVTAYLKDKRITIKEASSLIKDEK